LKKKYLKKFFVIFVILPEFTEALLKGLNTISEIITFSRYKSKNFKEKGSLYSVIFGKIDFFCWKLFFFIGNFILRKEIFKEKCLKNVWELETILRGGRETPDGRSGRIVGVVRETIEFRVGTITQLHVVIMIYKRIFK